MIPLPASVLRRLRRALWPIAQTTVAAAIAWYLAHDVLGHREPFFAPIAAAVCLWTTNLVRAELAVEMIIGVALGIAVGTTVLATLGAGPIGMGAAVLVSLTLAVLIAQSFSTQRTMFVNQSVISAILIVAFPHTGLGVERLYDALIGGGLAVVFSILLSPKNPLTVLSDARRDALTALRDILAQIDCCTGDPTKADQTWALASADRLHRRLAGLIEARGTARQLARVCPAGGRCATPSVSPITGRPTSHCWAARCSRWRARSHRPSHPANPCAPRPATWPPPRRRWPTTSRKPLWHTRSRRAVTPLRCPRPPSEPAWPRSSTRARPRCSR